LKLKVLLIYTDVDSKWFFFSKAGLTILILILILRSAIVIA